MVNPQATRGEIAERTGGARRPSSHHRERVTLSSIVAAAFDVSAKDICAPTRGPAKVALARQTALYLAHIVLGMTLSGAGRLYRRDRTTAAHACRLIEDRREKPDFDSLLSWLEDMVRARFPDHAAGDVGEGVR